VKYWIRFCCTERGYEKLTNGYEKFIWDDDERRKNVEARNSSFKFIEPGTNLCQLARINLYGLIKLSLLAVFWWWVIGAAISYPIQFFGVLIAIPLFIGFAIAVYWVTTSMFEVVTTNVKWGETLPVQYYKAVKGKYCPRITFTGTN